MNHPHQARNLNGQSRLRRHPRKAKRTSRPRRRANRRRARPAKQLQLTVPNRAGMATMRRRARHRARLWIRATEAVPAAEALTVTAHRRRRPLRRPTRMEVTNGALLVSWTSSVDRYETLTAAGQEKTHQGDD